MAGDILCLINFNLGFTFDVHFMYKDLIKVRSKGWRLRSKVETDPVRILVKKDESTLKGIWQFYIVVEQEGWKLDTLCDLFETLTITQTNLVINYDLPMNRKNYIHRIVLSDQLVGYLRDIEQFYQTEITEMPVDMKDLI